MDCPIRHIPSRIGLPSVHGRQVSAALGKVHSQQAAAPRTNAMPLPALHYEAYEALQVRAAIWNCVIWRRLPFARHRVPPGRYQGAIRLVEHSAARDGLKCYLSDRTVQLCIDFGREKRFLSGRVRSISGENISGANKTQADGFS